MYFTCSLLLRAVCCTMGYVSGSGRLSVCLSVHDQKKNIGKDFLIVYKHIEKLEISHRRTSAYLGVANEVHCIHSFRSFLIIIYCNMFFLSLFKKLKIFSCSVNDLANSMQYCAGYVF